MKENNLSANEKNIGKVTTIIDNYTIAINVGEDIVSVNDKIEIYIPGPQILDVDGKSELGRYDFVKDTLTVSNVFPKYSICKKPYTKKASSLTNLSAMFDTAEYTDYHTIHIDSDETTLVSFFDDKDTESIHIGDCIKLVWIFNVFIDIWTFKWYYYVNWNGRCL